MSSWHYNDNGAQRGPISTDELKAKIAAGELSGTSLVWEVGTKNWREAREFPELAAEIHTPPPLPKSVTIPAGTRSFATVIVDAVPAIFISLFIAGIALAIAIPQFKDSGVAIALLIALGLAITVGLIVWLRPNGNLMPASYAWRRFLAKMLDIEIACIFGFILVLLIRPENFTGFFLLYLLGAFGLWGVMDVGLRGKTLGRKLFGIVIEPICKEEATPSYFTRFAKMIIFGLGLGIPVLATIAMAVAYKRMRETGVASWDKDNFKVTCTSGSISRIVFGVFLLVFLVGIQGVLSKVSALSAISDTATHEGTLTSTKSVSSNVGAGSKRLGVAPTKTVIYEGIVVDVPQSWSVKTTQYGVSYLIGNGVTVGLWQEKPEPHGAMYTPDDYRKAWGPDYAHLTDIEIARHVAEQSGISEDQARYALGVSGTMIEEIRNNMIRYSSGDEILVRPHMSQIGKWDVAGALVKQYNIRKRDSVYFSLGVNGMYYKLNYFIENGSKSDTEEGCIVAKNLMNGVGFTHFSDLLANGFMTSCN